MFDTGLSVGPKYRSVAMPGSDDTTIYFGDSDKHGTVKRFRERETIQCN